MWIENDGTRQRLLASNLEHTNVFEIASVTDGTTLGRPVMSDDLVVWTQNTARDRTIHRVIQAYDLATGRITAIAESTWMSTDYAVSERRVVWTDPQLRIMDLRTGTASILDEGFAIAPTIQGDIIIWSGTEVRGESGYNLYVLDLQRGSRRPLVVAPGNQLNAVLVGQWLLWQSEDNTRSRVERLPFAAAVSKKPVQQSDIPNDQTEPQGEVGILSHKTSYTRPTHKGVHTAIGGGWQNSGGSVCTSSSCPAIDALGAPFEPFFGSFVLLDDDLSQSTGRVSPWGPTVADAMRHVQSSYNSRVVVRLYPTLAPNASGTLNPYNVAGDIVALTQAYDWIRHLQVHNEPNLAPNEWPASCIGCRWVAGGSTRTYSWQDTEDYRFYQAINQFYIDTWYEVDYQKNNHPDAEIRRRLQQMTLWSPPMTDLYRPINSTNANFYTYLRGMLSRYARMTYHTYPAPNYDADGSGGIKNNSWDKGFDDWVRTEISSGRIHSMITEFGWNPQQMQNCNVRQYDTWPTSGTCRASDGYQHKFDTDIHRFLTGIHRRGAQVVAPWLVRGWLGNEDPNGVDPYGNVRPWFHNYQWSSP